MAGWLAIRRRLTWSDSQPVTVYDVCVWYSYNGWLAGYQTAFDTAKSKVTQNNFAIGFSKDDVTVHTAV